MRGGYFLVYRSLFDPASHWHPHNTGEPANEAYAWLDMISMARFEPGDGLQRGQLYGSARTFAKRWNWGRSKASEFLMKLEAQGAISRNLGSGRKADAKPDAKRTRGGREPTIITICNYDTYQVESENGRTQSGREADATAVEKRTRRKNKEGDRLSTDVQRVVDHYLAVHPNRRVVDDAARRKIRARLKDGLTVEDLKLAIDGQARDPWCIEKNKMGLDWSLRNSDNAQEYMEKARAKKNPDKWELL